MSAKSVKTIKQFVFCQFEDLQSRLNRERDRETERDRERQRETERDRERQTETERQRETERDRQTERDRERQRETHTERDLRLVPSVFSLGIISKSLLKFELT